MTESAFFQDLAVLMTLTGLTGALFARFGWPKVFGYILAGIVMSEHTWGCSLLEDTASISTLGQLGVVFLMFAMGLSFSAKDMRRIRAVALPTAVLDTVVMIWLGHTLGTKFFGWGVVPSVFLGVAICDSATTLLAKVIDEAGWQNRPFAKYVLGTSLCEDIVCVGAIAVATGLATGGGMSLSRLLTSLGWLAVFFLSIIVFGFVFVPRLLKSVARQKDPETLVLTVLGCCFFVSYTAYRFDFSLALGAFLIGLICSTSDYRVRIVAFTEPFKSMFSAMFFASIGLLVNPQALWENAPAVLLVSLVVVVGKSLNVFVGSILCGLEVKTSVQNALSLAQIGEFAFMVAILYAGLCGDANTPMFQIAVGASLLTTFLNPLLICLSDPIGDAFERRLPERFTRFLADYRNWLEKIKHSDATPTYLLLKASLVKLGIYAVLTLAIFAVCVSLNKLDYSRFSVAFETHKVVCFYLAANVFAVSLLPMVVLVSRSIADEVAVLLVDFGESRWQQHVRHLVRFVSLSAVTGAFLVEWTMLDIAFAPSRLLSLAVFGVVVVAGVIGYPTFLRAGRRASHRFLEALTAEERREGLVRMQAVGASESPVVRLRLTVGSPAVGLTVGALNVRAKTGVTVVAIARGGVSVRNIGPDWEFHVDDELVVLGEPPQVAALKDLLGIVS